MPFEEPVEIAWILEPKAEGDLLDGDVHLLEAHAGILHHALGDEDARRMTGIAHADGMEPIFRDAEGFGITLDAPVFAIPKLDQLPELLEHMMARASKAGFGRCIRLSKAPEMQADERHMGADDRHGDPIRRSHLSG